jgi:hypothetical protein
VYAAGTPLRDAMSARKVVSLLCGRCAPIIPHIEVDFNLDFSRFDGTMKASERCAYVRLAESFGRR